MPDFMRKAAIKGGFATKKQTAYGTAVTDVDITEAHPYEGNQIDFTVEKIDDKDQAGKGNEFPTWQANTTCSTQGTMNFHASSYILGFGFALVNGKLVTSQPDDVGAPDTYEHECSMMDIDDPAVGKQLPCFTYVEQLSTDHKRKYRDMLVKSLALSGQTGEHLKLGLELLGSGHWETSSITMPSLVQTSFLRFVDIQFDYDGTPLSAQLKDVNFKHVNTLAENDGYFPGSGILNETDGAPQVRGRCLCSARSVELTFKMLIKNFDLETDMLNNTEKAITITAEGSTIETTYKHKLVLELPKVILKATKLGESDGFFVFDVETTILWDSTLNAPYKATIQNNVPEYLGTPT